MYLSRFLIAGAALALVAGSAQAQTPAAPPPTPAAAPLLAPAGDVIDTLRASGRFTIFLKGTDATNLTGFIKANKAETLFAPSDDAFKALPAGEVDRIFAQANRAELQKLLIYHLVNAKVASSEFKGSVRQAPTMAGVPVNLDGGDPMKVNDATILQADVMATNGVIHVIDKVLSPANPPAPPAQ